jgi:hypothetical protein
MFAPVAVLFYVFWSLYICYTIAAVNVLFIVVAFFVRPFSRVTARRLNEWMMSHLWPIYGYCLEVRTICTSPTATTWRELMTASQVLGGSTIRFTGDALPANVNQGNYVVISNHSYYCDWCPITCGLSQRYGRSTCSLSVPFTFSIPSDGSFRCSVQAHGEGLHQVYSRYGRHFVQLMRLASLSCGSCFYVAFCFSVLSFCLRHRLEDRVRPNCCLGRGRNGHHGSWRDLPRTRLPHGYAKVAACLRPSY